MAVIELRAEIPAPLADAWSEWLAESENAAFMVVEDRVSAQAWLSGYFDAPPAAEQAWAALAPSGELARPARMTLRELPDADWKESYKQHFRAWRFGPLHWVPVWERDQFRPGAGESVIWLDPGMAFGTGNHETTRLCCERLVTFAGRRGTRGRVLDAGCGSGILALSAARLGFRGVRAFDVDPVAVEVSRANAGLNGLAADVDFFVADLDGGLQPGAAELLLANIQADVLMRAAGRLWTAVTPGGQLVLSGILRTELAQVRDAFAAAAGVVGESRELGEWSDLVLNRPA